MSDSGNLRVSEGVAAITGAQMPLPDILSGVVWSGPEHLGLCCIMLCF